MPQILANPLTPERVTNRKRKLSRPWDAPAPLRLWHLASMDAPTVAVVWALGFAWAAGIKLPAWVPLLLALVTWSVYIGDRLLDARAGFRTGALHRLRQRHYFHWQHRGILVPLATAAVLAAAWIVFIVMPPGARERNSVLAAAALAYFARVHSGRVPFGRTVRATVQPRFLTKELLVGVLFTAGCALPAWSRSAAAAAPWSLLAPVIFFALLAWLNCCAIEYWESGSERPHIFPIACLLGLLGLLLAAMLYLVHHQPAALVAAGTVSALLLALLDRLRGLLTPLALRTAADLVLLTPALLILLPSPLR